MGGLEEGDAEELFLSDPLREGSSVSLRQQQQLALAMGESDDSSRSGESDDSSGSDSAEKEEGWTGRGDREKEGWSGRGGAERRRKLRAFAEEEGLTGRGGDAQWRPEMGNPSQHQQQQQQQELEGQELVSLFQALGVQMNGSSLLRDLSRAGWGGAGVGGTASSTESESEEEGEGEGGGLGMGGQAVEGAGINMCDVGGIGAQLDSEMQQRVLDDEVWMWERQEAVHQVKPHVQQRERQQQQQQQQEQEQHSMEDID